MKSRAGARTAEDLNSLMRLMILERMLNTERDDTDSSTDSATQEKRSPNRRNGRSKKTVQGSLGELTIATPRDRDGTF
ncbi:MAG: transposase, partial [Pirellulaceae bacterium]